MRTNYPTPKFSKEYQFKLVDSTFIHAIHLARAANPRYNKHKGYILGISFQADQDTIKWYDVKKDPCVLYNDMINPKKSPGFIFNNSVKGSPIEVTRVDQEEAVEWMNKALTGLPSNSYITELKNSLSNTYNKESPHKCCGKCEKPINGDLAYYLKHNLSIPIGKYSLPNGKWTLEITQVTEPNSIMYKHLQQIVTDHKEIVGTNKKEIYQDTIASKETQQQRTQRLKKEMESYWSPANVKAREEARKYGTLYEYESKNSWSLDKSSITKMEDQAKKDSVSYGPLLDTCIKGSSCISYLALGYNRKDKNFIIYYSLKSEPRNILAFFTDDGGLFRDWSKSESLGKFYNEFVMGMYDTFSLIGAVK
jgi:hypothetical protein